MNIITYILFYMVWNSPVHEAHPTAIPVMFTLYVTLNIVIALLRTITEYKAGKLY